jgi:isoleucyl-tRNA synthetase
LEPFAALVRDEVNVKRVRTSERIEEFAGFELRLNARVLGPRVGAAMKTVLAAAKAGRWERTAGGGVTVAGRALETDEYELRVQPLAERPDAQRIQLAALPTNDLVIALDVEPTPDLEREGRARDIVRLIQTWRKEAGLDVSDRIRIEIDAGDEIVGPMREHEAYVREQTLAATIEYAEGGTGPLRAGEVDGHAVRGRVTRV